MRRVRKLKFEEFKKGYLLFIYFYHLFAHTVRHSTRFFHFFLYHFSRVKMYEQINDCTF